LRAGPSANVVVIIDSAAGVMNPALRRRIDGISQRMLTVTLRQLERDGLVRRTVYPVVPPRVEYELTPLGRTLHDTIQALVAWTEEHQNEIAAARVGYDARAAAERNSRPARAERLTGPPVVGGAPTGAPARATCSSSWRSCASSAGSHGA